MKRSTLLLCTLSLLLLALPAQAGIFLEAAGSVQGPIGGDAFPPPGAGTIAVTSVDHGSAYLQDPTTGLPQPGTRRPTPIVINKAWDPASVPFHRALGEQEVFDTFELRIHDFSNQNLQMRIILRHAVLLAHSTSGIPGTPPYETWTVGYDSITWVHVPSSAEYEDLAPTSPVRVAAGTPAGGGSPLEFALPAHQPTTVDLLDADGRRVCRLFDGVAGAGESVRWDGTDERGQRVAPGLYTAEIVTASERTTRRVVLGQ